MEDFYYIFSDFSNQPNEDYSNLDRTLETPPPILFDMDQGAGLTLPTPPPEVEDHQEDQEEDQEERNPAVERIILHRFRTNKKKTSKFLVFKTKIKDDHYVREIEWTQLKSYSNMAHPMGIYLATLGKKAKANLIGWDKELERFDLNLDLSSYKMGKKNKK